ncbi:hypothetical protein NIES932_27240 [Raphidiopsis curvata NIES-932]|nr:hypothetical protein NIES932_27240 [Raphidiopsis curvata NIES-932]
MTGVDLLYQHFEIEKVADMWVEQVVMVLLVVHQVDAIHPAVELPVCVQEEDNSS